MIDEISLQGSVFLMCLASGAVFGLIFDFFRIIRRAVNAKSGLTNWCDAVFWIISTMFFMGWVFSVNDGELRWYVFVSSIIGALLYFLLISRFFVKVGVLLLLCIKKLLLFVFKIVFVPIKLIAKKSKKAVFFVFSPVRKTARDIKNIHRMFRNKAKLMRIKIKKI